MEECCGEIARWRAGQVEGGRWMTATVIWMDKEIEDEMRGGERGGRDTE